MIRRSLYSLETYLQDKSNHVRGNRFEEFSRDMLRGSFDQVYLRENIPQKHIKRIGLLREDHGIDLLGIRNKQYYAIQCKYTSNPEKKHTFKELSTFLAATSIYPKIENRVLVTNACRLNKFIKVAVANKTLEVVTRKHILTDVLLGKGTARPLETPCFNTHLLGKEQKDDILDIENEEISPRFIDDELSDMSYRTLQKLCMSMGIKGSNITRITQEDCIRRVRLEKEIPSWCYRKK